MAPLTWMVTGCASGFGEKFVPSIVARGDRVVAAALASQDISYLEGPNVKTLVLDITAPQAELDSKMKEALAFFDGIDVLVNNAGYLQLGLLEEISGEKFMAIYETNVIGTINLTRSILPHFRGRRSGKLIFMGSMFGVQGDVGVSPYSASKFALEGIVDSLQKELVPFEIKSMIINPGHFRTKILSPENVKYEFDSTDAYTEMRQAVMVGSAALNGTQPGDPSKAVERIVDVVRGEGTAAGKDFPKRLPLGSDSLAMIRKKCLETLKICDEWDEVITSTSF